MQKASKWLRFWNSPGWMLFFFKFFIFSILAILLWSWISIPYGKFLCERALQFQRRSIPIMGTRFTGVDDERFTFQIQMKPAIDEVVPLADPKPVSISIFPNTLHFNLIPFLALILATPIRTKKRFLLFLVIGLVLMFLSHSVHLYLNIKSFYYSQQTWLLNRSIPAHANFEMRIRLFQKLQGFMEQAGSMIVPFLLWMIYAQPWLFRKLRSNPNNQIAELTKNHEINDLYDEQNI